MGSFISQESIDEISLKTDIVQVVNEYVPLVQKGNDWWGCCPFHHEKTASFSVSNDKKFFYCFGCHKGGTAFNFIMEMEKVSYPESVEILAKKCGVKIVYSEGGSKQQKEDPNAKLKDEYINLYNRVTTTFHYMLMETEPGKFALDYITSRGISKEILEKFKIGYSPADRKWLRQFLIKKNYTKEFLDNSGLFSKKYPDIAFFSDRLMFPIFNRNGEVVAMGGRFLRGDSTNSPKYLNSGDLIQYKKGNTLYAFNFAKQAIRENKAVIFCEGYMDCIAYHQCGITYAVAPLGTALTEEQVLLVKPYVNTVYLSFDSDGAGQNATFKAILLCRKHDLSVKVIQIKGGKDPAEIMLNFGADSLTAQVKNAILDNDYLLSRLGELYPKDSPEAKFDALKEFSVYLDSLQSNIQKEACMEQFCRAFEIDPEVAKKDLSNPKFNSINRQNRNKYSSGSAANLPINEVEHKPAERIILTAELRAVITAVNNDVSLFQKMRNEISVDDLETSGAKQMFILLEDCSRSGNFSVSSILNRCENEELRGLILQLVKEYEANPGISVDDSIALLKRKALERKASEILNEMRRLERSALPQDMTRLSELLAQKVDIDMQINALKK